MDSLTMRKPDDFHVHYRVLPMLRAVLGYTARVFGRSMAMPNTVPPIRTASDAEDYRVLLGVYNKWKHEVFMAIKLLASTTPEIIREAYLAKVIAGKVYPVGVTTHSDDGISDFRQQWPNFAEMEELGMMLSLHGEMPGVFVLDRELRFLNVLEEIATAFPRLKIVLEHVSTADAVDYVWRNSPDNVAATITVHHLVLTLDDLIGGMLRPDHFCKPVVKTPADRMALVMAATSGNPKFFLGTDSAPWSRKDKECAEGCAGVFSAPVALPLYAQVFEQAGALDKLEAFASEFGAQHYGLPLNEGTITLAREPWEVPQSYNALVPLYAGRIIDWKVEE